MARAISGRENEDRRMDMGASGGRCDVAPYPSASAIFPVKILRGAGTILSCAREIGLHQRTKLRCNLRALAEPQFESADGLMQEHAEPVRRLQPARAGRL